MKLIKIIIAVLSLFSFGIAFQSCLRGSKPLDRVEARIHLPSDSSLRILRQIDVNSLDSESEKALYGLLMWSAIDRTAQPFPNDSLIDFSIAYFSAKDDEKHLAAALFYKARMYKRMNDHEHALLLYLKAAGLSVSSLDDVSRGNLHSDLADITLCMGDHKRAESEYRKSIIFLEKNDPYRRLSEVYLGLGKTFSIIQQYDSAEHYYKKALLYVSDKSFRSDYLFEVGCNYHRQRSNDSATYYLRTSLALPDHNESNLSACYYTLGRIFFDEGKLDSADVYARHSLDYSTNIYDQREAYKILTDIEFLTIGKDQAPYYVKLYEACNDSIRRIESRTKLLLQGNSYSERHFIPDARTNYSIIFISIFVILIIFIVIILFMHVKSKNEKRAMEQKKYEERNSYLNDRISLIHAKIDVTKKQLSSGKKLLTIAEKEEALNSVYNEIFRLDNFELFVSQMEIYAGDFLNELKVYYPSLSEKELIWCILQLFRIDQSDILTIIGYKPSGYGKFKQRLARRLGVSNASALNEFLQDFFEKYSNI
ncbi:MAG: tetratricopeptide repeat protein [Dysgonomonas sp.]